MLSLDEDYQAWEEYPQHRWVFNKLEVALKLGYKAGPACVPLPKTSNTLFKAIIRPIYNLYGMGISAKVKTFRPMIDNEFIINHGIFLQVISGASILKGHIILLTIKELINLKVRFGLGSPFVQWLEKKKKTI